MITRLLQFLLWSLGYFAFQFYRTVLKVLGRESLEKPSTDGLSSIEVVRACLQACLEDRLIGPHRKVTVLCAGFRHFREPWARDFGFACFGLLAEDRSEVAKEGLRLFFHHQKQDGQLPLKLHSTVLIERYLHSLFARVQPNDSDLIPRFITAHGTRSLDSVLLLIIAWGETVSKTADRELAIDLYEQAQFALSWVELNVGRHGLLYQGPFADWADSIARRGAVFYTNILWWKAIRSVEEVELWLYDHQFERFNSSEGVKDRLQTHFYCEELGFFKATPYSKIFTSAPNFLAVSWGLATPEQAGSILDYADVKQLAQPVPTQVTDRDYPFYMVGMEMWIAGISTYHTSCAWTLIGAWHVIASVRAGRIERARELLDKILSVVERDRTVYEVHALDSHPLATRLYHSEEPLSWNAAMILYAHSIVLGAENR